MSEINITPPNNFKISMRANNITSNVGDNFTLDASGSSSMILRTNGTTRLTINNAGAWTVQGGMNYDNSNNYLTASKFIGDLSGNSTSTTNISGGVGGSIPYQSSANTTAFLSNGTSGQILTSNGGTSAPSWSTPSSGGISINTASQIINQEFIENFSTFTAQNYPFALTNNANYSQPTVQNRLGVCAIQSASNTPTYIATTSQWTPVMINSSSTGLGITFIVSPFNGNFTSGNTKIWVGMNVSYTGFALTSNNCACFWLDQTVSNTWGCRIGDSPITYFAAPNVADWLVLRMYPDSSGNGIYFNYYNQTTSTSAGTAYIPYTSQGPTTNVSNTTPMYVGFGILSSIASQRFIYADYMGVQSAINRIYS